MPAESAAGPGRTLLRERAERARLTRCCQQLARRFLAAARGREAAEAAGLRLLLHAHREERRVLRSGLAALLRAMDEDESEKGGDEDESEKGAMDESEKGAMDESGDCAQSGGGDRGVPLCALVARAQERYTALAARAKIRRAERRAVAAQAEQFLAEVQCAVESAARRIFAHGELLDACDALRAAHSALGVLRRATHPKDTCRHVRRERSVRGAHGAAEEMARRLAAEMEAHRQSVLRYETQLHAMERELAEVHLHYREENRSRSGSGSRSSSGSGAEDLAVTGSPTQLRQQRPSLLMSPSLPE